MVNKRFNFKFKNRTIIKKGWIFKLNSEEMGIEPISMDLETIILPFKLFLFIKLVVTYAD